MIDQAGILMAQDAPFACERIEGVNDNMMKSHYHHYYELYFLEAGERMHVIRDDIYRNRPGELLLFAPYTMHHSYGAENVSFKRIVLYFRKELIDGTELAEILRGATGLYHPDNRTRQQLHRILKTLIAEQETPGRLHEAYGRALINTLLLLLLRNTEIIARAEKRDRISDIVEHIHLHYDEELSLEALSQRFFISPYHLCREFKRYTNRTLVQYINITRVMHAQRRFLETNENVTEVSRATGFSNLTHFNRVFKSVTGMSPSYYRKSQKYDAQ